MVTIVTMVVGFKPQGVRSNINSDLSDNILSFENTGWINLNNLLYVDLDQCETLEMLGVQTSSVLRKHGGVLLMFSVFWRNICVSRCKC